MARIKLSKTELNFTATIGGANPAAQTFIIKCANADGTEIPIGLVGTDVACGNHHMMVLTPAGTVFSCGYGEFGQMGNGTKIVNNPNWIQADISNVVKIATGGNTSYAILANGDVYAWGSNNKGQCGDGTTVDRTVPVKMQGLSNITAAAGGGFHVLLLKNDGTVWSVGYNGVGQLGLGDTTDRSIAVQIPGLSNVTEICAGGHISAALVLGQVYEWGWNNGQSSPTLVAGLTGVLSLSAGSNHLIARMDSGSPDTGLVKTWGKNSMGQIGDGTTNIAVTPKQIWLSAPVVKVFGGQLCSFALLSDGSAACWGYNAGGKLGNGNDTNQLSPTFSNCGSGITIIRGGEDYSIFLYADRTAKGIGYETYGQLGNGNVSNTYNLQYHQCSAVYTGTLPFINWLLTEQDFETGIDPAWLMSAPTTGRAEVGDGGDTITCSINIAGLHTSKSAWVTIGSPEASNTPQKVLVRLIMTAARPTITVSTASIYRELPKGGAPITIPITVTNTGQGILAWTASATSTNNFLSISPTSGGNGTIINAVINPNQPTEGLYSGNIVISDPNATNTPVTIPVTMKVSILPYITPAPSSVTMTGMAGGINPAQAVNLTLSDYESGEVCNWTGSIHNDTLGCLSLSVTSGVLNAGNGYSGSFTVAANMAVYAGIISPVILNANVRIAAAGAIETIGNSPKTIPVTVTINPAPLIIAAPNTLSFESWIGGAQAPPQNVNINIEGISNWETVSSQAWLNCVPTTGTTDAVMSVSVSSVGLPAGVYTGTITVREVGNPAVSDVINAAFTVHSTLTPTITVNPTLLNVYGEVNGAFPSNRTITIINTGDPGSMLAWTATKNAAWITSLTPNTGGSGGTTTANFDTTGLAAGIYAGQITITDANASNSPVNINVTLQIYEAGAIVPAVNYNQMSTTGNIAASIPKPHLLPDPVSLAFTAALNGQNPAPQVTTILNTGGGTINWDAVMTSVSAPATIFQVDGGGYFSGAVLDNGKVRVWGSNDRGALGNGTGANSLTPITVPGIATATMIAFGTFHALALLSDGTIKSWGANDKGQLGDGTTADRATPVTVSGITTAKYVAAGGEFSFAILTDNTVMAWGRNLEGQLGDGTKVNKSTPFLIPGLTSVSKIAAGATHTAALIIGGTCKSWGQNYWGQLGDGTTTERLAPQTIPGITGVNAISCGDYHTVARTAGNVLRAWGDNQYGQIGDGTTTNRLSPAAVTNIAGATFFTSKGSFNLAVMSGGGCRAWGDNRQGQLGIGNTVNKSIPTDVIGITTGQMVGCGWLHSLCVLLDNMTVMAWGDNIRGQLGAGTTTDSLIPIKSGNVIGLVNDVVWANIVPTTGGHNTVCTVTVINDFTAAGDYNAYAVFTDPGADNTPVTLPITVTITAGIPIINVIPASLDFGYIQVGGVNPVPRSVSITNIGTGILSWTAVSNAPAWCSVVPGSGTGIGTITVSLNIAALAIGTYNTTITIGSPDPAVALVNIPVQVIITDIIPIISVLPASLTCNYAIGGVLPANQNITITNIGGGTLTWKVETNAGWVTILPTSGAGTPAVVSIGTNVSGLTPGIYNGTITISETIITPGVLPVIVPITLNVTGDVILDVDVTSDILVFEAPVGGTNPPAQTFTVLNRGGGALSWVLTEGMHYLSCTPTTGGNNTLVTAAVNVLGLVQGIYKDNITITDISTQVKTVAVYVIIGGGAGVAEGDPTISVIPTSLTFTVQAGAGNPDAQTVTVNNIGDGQLEWQSISNRPWISFFPTQGNDGAQIRVRIDVTKLTTPYTPGVYTGMITVVDPGSTNQQVEIPVTLNLTAAASPILWADKDTIIFNTLITGGEILDGILVENRGSGTLNWTVTGGTSWLECLPASGSGDATIVVRVHNYALLGIGVHNRTLIIDAPGASGTPKAVNVILNITDLSSSIIMLDPFQIEIKADKKGGIVSADAAIDDWMQLYSQFSWSLASDSPWLTAAPMSGIGQGMFDVNVNPAALNVGDYIGYITVTEIGSINTGVRLKVKVTVTDIPQLHVNRAIMTYSGAVGSPISSQNFVISNAGGGILYWAVSDDRGWITCAPAHGDAVQGSPDTVSVFVSTAGKVAGEYVGTITVEGQELDSQSILLRMVLTGVGELPPLLDVNPSPLAFAVHWTKDGQQIPGLQYLTIENVGGGVLRWQAASSKTWIGIAPASGIGSKLVRVSINPTTLLPGTVYDETITITNQDNTGDIKIIPVRITTGTASPAIGIAPETIHFTTKVGGTLPSASSFAITNTGGRTLNWTITTNKTWLGAAPASGSNNAIIAVSILNLTGLSQGTHTGRITIASNDANTPTKDAVVVLTLTEGDPIMEIVPLSLTFNGMKTMADPISQSVRVRNTGEGTLLWQASTTTEWITIQNGTWTAGSTFRVLVDSDNPGVIAGTNTGTITVSAAGLPSQTVTVTFHVVAAPTTPGVPFVFPTIVNLTAYEGDTIADVNVTYRCPGATNTPWTARSNKTWINVTPSSGSTAYAETRLIFDAGGLSAGTHTGNVRYETAAHTAQVNITLIILTQRAVISPNPTSLQFDAMFGDAAYPAPQIITIHNMGIVPLNWRAHQTVSWIQLTPMAGTDDRSIGVQIITDELAVGTYNGTVVVRDDEASNTPVVIPIVLKIWAMAAAGDGNLATLETADGALKITFMLPWPYQPGQVKEENRGRLRQGGAYSYLKWVKPTFKIIFNALSEHRKLYLEALFGTGMNMYFTPDTIRRPWERYLVFYNQSNFALEPRQPEYWGEAWWEGSITLTGV